MAGANCAAEPVGAFGPSRSSSSCHRPRYLQPARGQQGVGVSPATARDNPVMEMMRGAVATRVMAGRAQSMHPVRGTPSPKAKRAFGLAKSSVADPLM